MASVPVTDEVLRLSGIVRERAERTGSGLLWPRVFADDLNEPLEKVVAAFEVLAAQGYVVARTRVRCENEHVWEGEPAQVPEACPVCDVTYDQETTWVELKFEKKKDDYALADVEPREDQRSVPLSVVQNFNHGVIISGSSLDSSAISFSTPHMPEPKTPPESAKGPITNVRIKGSEVTDSSFQNANAHVEDSTLKGTTVGDQQEPVRFLGIPRWIWIGSPGILGLVGWVLWWFLFRTPPQSSP